MKRKYDADGESYPRDQDTNPIKCQWCKAQEVPVVIDGEWCCVECEGSLL